MKAIKQIFDPKKLSTLLFYSSILVFIIAFNFAHNPSGGWTQQFMPFLNNRPIADITFLDSLTGYAVTGNGLGGIDTNYIVKTTDAGSSWNIIYNSISDFRDFRRVVFLNLDTGYVLKGDSILRTTNGGEYWNSIPVPPDNFGFTDMFPISFDTLWVSTAFIGGEFLYRTTNSGLSWTRQLQGNGFDRIYFYNNRIGFVGSETSTLFLKTTNSGINWISVPGQRGFKNIFFVDSLFGWKTTSQLRKTTDGGLGWYNVDMPSGGNIINSSCQDFSVINKDSIWAVGGEILYPNNQIRGTLNRTTNEGNNWDFQIPDTSIHIAQYWFCKFVNKLNGWNYVQQRSGIYTSKGGDTNFVTNIKSSFNISPGDFVLFQNYPNPFNPVTKINYEIKKISNVSIVIYDILGKQISKLVNRKQSAGKYEIEFNASELNSGIYFYSLLIDNFKIDTKKMMLIR